MIHVNAYSIVQLVVKIKNIIMINVNVGLKSIVRVKKIIVRVLALAFAKTADIYKVLLKLQ